MKVTFGTVALSTSDATGNCSNVRINGEQQVQTSEFFRGTAATTYPRGNLTTRFQFVTSWIFSTVGAAEVFVLTHTAPGNLPMSPTDRSTVTVQCGFTGALTNIYMANAALKSANIINYRGLSVDVEYTIEGPYFQTTAP